MSLSVSGASLTPTLAHVSRCVLMKSSITSRFVGGVAMHRSSSCFCTHWAGIPALSVVVLVRTQFGHSKRAGEESVPKANLSSTKYLL